MAILGKLLSDGLEGAGENMAKKALKEVSEKSGESVLSKLGKKLSSNVDDVVGKNADDMVTLYRGLTQKYDPKFPVSRLDTSGYESFTDNLDLARQYGDNVVSINIPKRDIKTSYLDENPMSPTYGDRNPIYSIDKPAGLNGVSGKEYLLEVGSDYQKALKYNELANDLDNASKYLGINGSSPVRHIPVQQDNYVPLYHQTSANSLDDFSLDKRSAGLSDATMPEGIFLKDTDADIGLPGKNQLQLDARLNNPLRVINRDDLKAKLMGMDPKVARYLRAENDIDNLYTKLSDEAQAAVDKAYEKMYYDKSEPNKKAFAEAVERMNGIIPEWREKIKENAAVSQKEIKNLLKKNGYDGMIMDEDRGSFGRKVKSYLVLDKEQLRDNSVPVKFGKSKDFGKSVIVDKNGNLLDLYHGTDADFDKFGDIKTEPGYWFTEDKDYAQSHGKNLMTVNLDMRNPIDMTTAEGDNLLYNLARERFGIKGDVPENKIFSKEFREFLQSKGYDGLIWDKDGKNTYVAFRPEQIKMRNKKLTK